MRWRTIGRRRCWGWSFDGGSEGDGRMKLPRWQVRLVRTMGIDDVPL